MTASLGAAGAAHAEPKAPTPTTQQTAPSSVTCPSGDLVRLGQISSQATTGNLAALRGQPLVREGSLWDRKTGVYLSKRSRSHVTVDLRKPRLIRYLVVQADAKDAFKVSVSEDGQRFRTVWTPGTRKAMRGQRAQWYTLSRPTRGRYLRLEGRLGDGHYYVSSLQAYCQQPAWPPALNQPPQEVGWKRLDRPVMLALKGTLGIAGAGILWLGFAYPWRQRGPRRPRPWPIWLTRRLPWLDRTSRPTATAPSRLRDWLRRWWGRPIKQRSWVEVPLLLAAGAAVTHTFVTSKLPGLIAGGALLAVWYILRWLTGDATRPRRLVPGLATRLTGYPGGLVYAGLAVGATVASYSRFGWVKAALLLSTAIVVFLWLRWARRPVSAHNTARLALGFLGLCGLVGWWNAGHFHYDHYVHIWEHYHYFIGSKYGPELRYARIYECTAVADHYDGYGARVRARKMRRLGTDNELGTTDEILKHPERCRGHFTPERWTEFRKDIRFFRARFSKDRWDRSQTDHGYNATPVWGVGARLLAEAAGDLTWEKIEQLAAIDSILLLAMWLAILWGFGWQATAVALIYWGFNFPARYYWNGGAFLRYDWLFLLGLGLVALRRRQHFLAGMALTLSTGLRVFPGLVVAAIILKAVASMVKERRIFLSRQHASFAAGCLTLIALALPASNWSMNGLDAWSEFAANSRKHLNTALTNNMGLKTVLGYDYSTRASVMRDNSTLDPFQGWKDARVYFYAKRKPLFLLLVGMFTLVLAVASTRDEEDWVIACLGAGLIPIAVELTCYYYGFLLAYGLLWPRRKLPGILAAALAGLTNILNEIPWNDDKYMAMSLATVIVVVVVTAHAAFGPTPQRKREAEGDDASPAGTDAPDLPIGAAARELRT